MTRTQGQGNRPQKRANARLAPTLDKGLLAYAAMATAAGIGLQPAEGKVVYTPANVGIPLGGSVHVDINNDGISDFVLYNEFSQGRRYPEGNFQSGLLVYGSVTGNGVWGVESKGLECAAVLPKGVKVGAGEPFAAEAALFSENGSYTRGVSSHCKWRDAHRGAFLGLKFVIAGETHYGWAHVTAGANYLTTPVNGYAYETVPNKSILTGAANGPDERAAVVNHGTIPPAQPATLGLLAQGERGLAVWRKSDEPESARLL